MVCRCLKPFAGKFKNYQLKHERVWWVVFVTYIAVMTTTLFGEKTRLVQTVTALIICSVGFLISAGLIVQKYLESVRMERDYLKAQQQLVELHYAAIYSQIRQMNERQRDVDKNMQEIIKMEERGIDAENIISYLRELKSEYEGIRAGVYCDDWMIDALLFHQSELIRRQDIAFECSMTDYEPDRIDTKDLTEMLLYLLHLGMWANQSIAKAGERWIKLRTAVVRNQLIIEFGCSCMARVKLQKRLLRQYVRKYNGTWATEHDRTCLRIVLTFECADSQRTA